ncbi:OsmC family protein [Novipirellula artificiosorum]|uniref:OsmC-like protein n=1 Tax=Novipirellula artificiosorum TaxID=2528016 RepID=A0A5C6DC06_9BACT|nr:OsmC family protein [Novipirellula artificiosorum]TWU33384.1 OsmC-like protein [Novipirellula artificiosorum]
MSVAIQSVYLGELRVQSTHGPSQRVLTTDAPVDNGGRGSDFSPTDLVATALGSCLLTILALVAERHQIDLSGSTVSVTKEMVAQPVRRIGRLESIVTIPAARVDDLQMRERLEAAARKCPVHQSLHPSIDAPISFVYEVE